MHMYYARGGEVLCTEKPHQILVVRQKAARAEPYGLLLCKYIIFK